MPHFADPALIFDIENTCSNCVFTASANSHFETTKSLTKDSACTALLKWDLRDLKTDTSRG